MKDPTPSGTPANPLSPALLRSSLALDPILLRAARRAQREDPGEDDWGRGTLGRFLMDAQAAWFEVER